MRKKLRKLFWILYFLLFCIFAAVLYKDYLNHFPNLALRDFADLIAVMPISLLVLFEYSLKKKIFSKKFWRRFFWFTIIDMLFWAIYASDKTNSILSIFYKSNLATSNQDYSVLAGLVGLVVMFPFFYALYRLGYPKKAKLSIDWVIIITDKYEESVKFYRDILGFKVKEEVSKDEFCKFKLPSGIFAIFGRKQMEKLVGKGYLGKSGGALYTFPESEDVDRQYEELKAKGVKFIKDLETQPWGQRTAYFTDPDGHIWEIQQWVKKRSWWVFLFGKIKKPR